MSQRFSEEASEVSKPPKKRSKSKGKKEKEKEKERDKSSRGKSTEKKSKKDKDKSIIKDEASSKDRGRKRAATEDLEENGGHLKKPKERSASKGKKKDKKDREASPTKEKKSKKKPKANDDYEGGNQAPHTVDPIDDTSRPLLK